MALAQPTEDFLFKPMSVELSFIGIDQFPREALRDSVAKGKTNIQFDGVRFASEYGVRQQMNYTVLMRQYDMPNFYQPYAVETSIEGRPDKARRFDLTDVPLTIENMQNLLNGRHVEKHRFDRFAEKVETYWYRLDFSKHGKDGYPLHETSASELARGRGGKKWNSLSTAAELINAFPLGENLLPGLRFQLANDVARGNVTPVTVLTDGGSVKGYLQFGERPDKIDLLVYKGGKLVKVTPDLKDQRADIEKVGERRARKRPSV
jgi:hypothetical protein